MSELRLRAEGLALTILRPVIVDFCWCGGPWAQQGSKTKGRPKIHLTDEAGWDFVSQIVVHECAHIIRGEGGHPAEFWALLKRLVREHLKTDLNEHQSKMMRDYLHTPAGANQ